MNIATGTNLRSEGIVEEVKVHRVDMNKYLPATNTYCSLIEDQDAYYRPSRHNSREAEPTKKYDVVLSKLRNGRRGGIVHETTGLYIERGAILDKDGNILILVTSENEGINRSYAKCNKTHIFVNLIIMDTTKYKPFYKKIKEKFLELVIREGGQLHICSEETLNANCFVAVEDAKPKVNTIEGMEAHIEDLKKSYYDKDFIAENYATINMGNFYLIEDMI